MNRTWSVNSSTETTCAYRITKTDVAFTVSYAAIVLAGVVGNSMVITVVRKNRSMHNSMNYLLLNLAVADLITLLFCPGTYDFALVCVSLPSTIGDFLCKVFVGNAVVPITINVAVLTVSAIAVERYLALTRPLQTNQHDPKVPYVIGCIWVIATLSCIPDFMSNTYNDPVASSSASYPCSRPWSLDEQQHNQPFIATTCFLFGFLPSLLLIFCYFQIIRGLFFTNTICAAENAVAMEEEKRTKRKLARLSLCLTALFVICSLPFAVFFVHLLFEDAEYIRENYDRLHVLHRVTRFLLFSNSFLNPVLYTFQSSNYRAGFASLCCRGNEIRVISNEMVTVRNGASAWRIFFFLWRAAVACLYSSDQVLNWNLPSWKGLDSTTWAMTSCLDVCLINRELEAPSFARTFNTTSWNWCLISLKAWIIPREQWQAV